MAERKRDAEYNKGRLIDLFIGNLRRFELWFVAVGGATCIWGPEALRGWIIPFIVLALIDLALRALKR